ncbi:AraC family transcriptional regulator [Flammeovirga sp. SubArs3]|uniref:AraC family transcriptional regulator n=1 Tax=Flammeovirga sp. SubArs3 TaxID=2995316 RepID=UPI00248CFB86|nr:AraC family transcriptional regulator [Flammeovirga sp. SubArs3]
MNTNKKKELQEDYRNRINRVFTFIDKNLGNDLSLDKVAEIAYFSPFHFHRIFKLITGETLNEYVKRKRIEKSAADLLHKNISISEIAHHFGFSDASSYSKAFKKYFKESPTSFIKLNHLRHSKIRQVNSKNGQEYPNDEKYLCIINNLRQWMTMNAKIEIVELPKMNYAYVSCIGPQNLGNAFQQLIQWATPKGLMHDQVKMMTVYHDSFKITEPNKVRMSASILLQKDETVDGAIALSSFSPQKCIVGHFEINPNEFEKAWTGMFLWMNENGYKKAEQDPFEIYHNNFNEHPEGIAIVDFYIPIELT